MDNGVCRPGESNRQGVFAVPRRSGIVAAMRNDNPGKSDDDDASGPPPDAANLYDVAVAYLARYSATRATLARALNRRIDRWVRAAGNPETAAQAAAAKRLVPEVVSRLAAAGAVDDAAFAQSRARKLSRTGHSHRAAAAHLAARGVPSELVRSALPEDEAGELAAAVIYLRRRRLGPFRTGAAPPDVRMKEQGSLARAGFTAATARLALALTAEEAEALVLQRRRRA
jgi:regulatory protein